MIASFRRSAKPGMTPAAARDSSSRSSRPIHFEQDRHPPPRAHHIHVTVGAGKDAGADPAAVATRPLRRYAAVGRRRQVHGASIAAARLAAIDADVDPLARKPPFAGMPIGLGATQRQQHRQRRRRAGVVAGVVAGELERLAVGRTRRVQRPADRLQRQLRPAVVAVGTGLSERGDRAEHQTRIDRVQHLPAPAGGRRLPGHPVLHDHINLAREPAHGGRAVVGVRVEHDRELVGVEVQEQARTLDVGCVARKRVETPRRVAAARLDLDHPRPIIGQQLGRVRPGDVARKIENLKACERPVHACSVRNPRAAGGS